MSELCIRVVCLWVFCVDFLSSHSIYMMTISFCIVCSEDLLPVAPSLPCSVCSVCTMLSWLWWNCCWHHRSKGNMVFVACRWRNVCACPGAHRWFKSSACKGMQQTWPTESHAHTSAYSDITIDTWINRITWARTYCLYRSVFKTNMSSWNTVMC